MRIRKFKLPDGTFYCFGEYRVENLLPVSRIRKVIDDKALARCYHYKSAEDAARRLSGKIISRFMFHVVEHLMNSDRVDLGKGRFFYIGIVNNKDNGIFAKKSYPFSTVATGGKKYGICIQGEACQYYVRMPARRRRELRDRIVRGQQFYG